MRILRSSCIIWGYWEGFNDINTAKVAEFYGYIERIFTDDNTKKVAEIYRYIWRILLVRILRK